MPTARLDAAALKSQLRLPVIGAPLFIVSNPDLVIAQCTAGIVGSFPALNARPQEKLADWLTTIRDGIDRWNDANPDAPAAPYAVNQIVHRSNDRLMRDLEDCVKFEVPIVICSLGAREDVYEAVHSYGGLVLHDVINQTFAHKAIDKGADGLIAVAAGAGGHAGGLSPFAFMQELRAWFDGPIALSGSIATGEAVLACEAMGADFAYIGSPFIAMDEANASDGYKDAIVNYGAEDIVYTNLFTGVHGNYLKPSIEAAGLDPNDLPESDPSKMDFGSGGNTDKKAWKDIWGCGQGIGAIEARGPTRGYVDGLAAEYAAARARLGLAPGD
ncbi:MAG: nitronate monooxygenase family protein [Pseudomonadota bacterium]